MGKFSREKGRRGEQQLVLYGAKKGYKCERILRQYQEAGQPDVKMVKNGVTYTFENKAYKSSFKTIYDLYYADRDADGVLSFVLASGQPAVAVSNDFEQLLITGRHFRNLTLFPPSPKALKVYQRIIRLDALRQSADFLCIKDNGKVRLFMRFWV